MKQRIQVSLNPELLAVAREIMKARKFDTVSEFLEALIREEWERRYRSAPLDLTSYGRANDVPEHTEIPTVGRAVSYRKSKRSK